MYVLPCWGAEEMRGRPGRHSSRDRSKKVDQGARGPYQEAAGQLRTMRDKLRNRGRIRKLPRNIEKKLKDKESIN